MKHIYLDTPDRKRLYLYPTSIKDVRPSPITGYDLVVYHKENNEATLHLTNEEAAEFVGLMWKPVNCRMPQGACWGRRESPNVPPECGGCRLRKHLYEVGFNDYRDPLRTQEHFLKVPVLYAVGLMACMWTIGKTVNVTVWRVERERDYWQARAVRAEATFKRQAEKGRER